MTLNILGGLSNALLLSGLVSIYASPAWHALNPDGSGLIVAGFGLFLAGALLTSDRLVNPAVLLALFVLVFNGAATALAVGYLPLESPASRQNLYLPIAILCGQLLNKRGRDLVVAFTVLFAVLDVFVALTLYYTDFFWLYRKLGMYKDPTSYFYGASTLKRAYGISIYPIVTAASAAWLLFYALWRIVFVPGKRIVWLLCGIASALVLILTQSRLYVLSLIPAVALFVVLTWRRSRKVVLSASILLVIGVGVGYTFLSQEAGANLLDRWLFMSEGFSSDSSLQLHRDNNLEGLQLVIENPIGYGPGYASVDAIGHPIARGQVWTESTWIKIAVEEGVPFVAVTLVLVIAGLVRGVNGARRDSRMTYAVAVILSMAVVGLSFPVGLYVVNVWVPGILLGHLLRLKRGKMSVGLQRSTSLPGRWEAA